MTTNHTMQIVDKAWNFAHVLRDDGLLYMAYTEQITFPTARESSAEGPESRAEYGSELDKDQKRHLRTGFVHGLCREWRVESAERRVKYGLRRSS